MNYHDVLLNRRVVYDAACPESMWGEAQELATWFAIPQILGMVTGRKPTPATPVALEDHIDHYPLRSSLDADDPELNPMRAIRRNALLNPFNGQVVEVGIAVFNIPTLAFTQIPIVVAMLAMAPMAIQVSGSINLASCLLRGRWGGCRKQPPRTP